MHRMVIEPERRLVKQAQRYMHPDMVAKIEVEVDKLVKAGFTRKVQYPIYSVNVILIKRRTDESGFASTSGT